MFGSSEFATNRGSSTSTLDHLMGAGQLHTKRDGVGPKVDDEHSNIRPNLL